MIAFSSRSAIDGCGCCCSRCDDCRRCGDGDLRDERNFLLSVKCSDGYCVSKALLASVGVPRQLTIIITFDDQADVVAVPELFSSVFIPWRRDDEGRQADTERAFRNAGLCGLNAACLATAVEIIYDAIDRHFVYLFATARDCIFTSSGLMELNDDCRERLLSINNVISDFDFDDDGDLPF